MLYEKNIGSIIFLFLPYGRSLSSFFYQHALSLTMHGLGYDSMWCVVGCGVYSVRPKERPVNTSYGFFFFFHFALRFMGLLLRLFCVGLDSQFALRNHCSDRCVLIFMIFPRNCQYCTLYLSIGYGVYLTGYTKRNLVRSRGQ